MALFKKKSHFEDKYLLKLEMNKKTKGRVETALKELELEKASNTFPILQFNTAEQFFKKLMSEENEIELTKVLIILNEGGKQSSEGELFIENFVIDFEYQNILKPLSEVMFNQMPFSSEEFDDKIRYLKDIFASWQSSTALPEEHLPELPDFEEEEETFIELDIPYYRYPSRYQKEVTSEVEDNKAIEGLGELSLGKLTFQGTGGDIDEDISEPQDITPKEPFQPQPTQEVAQIIPQQATQEIVSDISDDIPQETQDFVKSTDFDLKHLTTFDVEDKRPGDNQSDYIKSKLDEFKGHLNQKIKALDKEVVKIQTTLLEQKMRSVENQARVKLAEDLALRDTRASLYAGIIENAKKEFVVELQSARLSLEQKRQAKLEEAKRVYEATVAGIRLEYSQELENSESNTRHQVMLAAKNTYQTTYESETQNLKEWLAIQEDEIEDQKRLEVAYLSQRLHFLIETQDNKLQKHYQDMILNKEKEFKAEYLEDIALKQARAVVVNEDRKILDLTNKIQEMSEAQEILLKRLDETSKPNQSQLPDMTQDDTQEVAQDIPETIKQPPSNKVSRFLSWGILAAGVVLFLCSASLLVVKLLF